MGAFGHSRDGKKNREQIEFGMVTSRAGIPVAVDLDDRAAGFRFLVRDRAGQFTARSSAQYEAHYNGRRPHRSRQLHPPRPDYPVADLSQKRIQRQPVLGGLINEYERAA